MSTFVSGFKSQPSGDFLTRYANNKKAEKAASSHTEKAEFEVGYTKGKMRLAVASKFMKLSSCGCNRFVEDEAPHIVWATDGDQIVRIEDDLSWVDELLEGENNEVN